MNNNDDLVRDVRQAFAKSSREKWLKNVEDASIAATVFANFDLEFCDVTLWQELRRRGIVVSSMQVSGQKTVLAYLTRASHIEEVEETIQEQSTCECCGQKTQKKKIRTHKEIKTEGHDV